MTIADQPMIDSHDLDRALAAFRRDYPAFDGTRALDELRATEYARLDALGQVYLDYTGGGLYAESQLREHMALLSQNVFGNPHSRNPTSMAMTHLADRARALKCGRRRSTPSGGPGCVPSPAAPGLRPTGTAARPSPASPRARWAGGS